MPNSYHCRLTHLNSENEWKNLLVAIKETSKFSFYLQGFYFTDIFGVYNNKYKLSTFSFNFGIFSYYLITDNVHSIVIYIDL